MSKKESSDNLTKKMGQSQDPFETNKEKLMELFPGVVSDGRIDCEELSKLVGIKLEDSKERYGMSWAGKSNCFNEIERKTTKTLRVNREESVDFDDTNNIFIEGDNLEVLKVLQRSYYGKVKMIYIDPPYNTGNDFIYKDTFARSEAEEGAESGEYNEEGNLTQSNRMFKNDKSKGRYHSNWLNMMYPRLFLARNLLKDDGVIFISIDDNEQANLKKLCDEIFGEENFITKFVWEKTQHFGRQKTNFYGNADYILCYAKNKRGGNGKDFMIRELLVEKIKSELEDAPLYNASNNFSELVFPTGSIKFNLSDGAYEETTSGDTYKLLGPVIVKNSLNANPMKIKFRSRWNQKKIDTEYKNGTSFWVKSDKFSVRAVYPSDKQYNESPKQIIFSNTNNPLCAYTRNEIKVGTSESGSSEVKDLFSGEKLFDYPKPSSLLMYLCSLIFDSRKEEFDKNGIYLDFFAGSGTTAHAVMAQNAQDGGNRKCISVQLPEEVDEDSEAARAGYENIAQIARERIRRAGEKIKEDFVQNNFPQRHGLEEVYGYDKQEIGELESETTQELDTGFKAYTLDDSNFKIWNTDVRDEENLEQQMLDLIEQSFAEDATEENMLYELILKNGLPLTIDIERKEEHYLVDGGNLAISLTNDMTQEIFDAMLAQNPNKIIILDSSFAGNNQLKSNLLLQAKDKGVDDVVVI